MGGRHNILHQLRKEMKTFTTFLCLAASTALAHHEEVVIALDAEHTALKEAATTSIAAAAAATEDGDVEQRDNEVGTPVYAAQPQPIYAAPYPLQYQPVHFVPVNAHYRSSPAPVRVVSQIVPQYQRYQQARQFSGSAGLELGPLGGFQVGGGAGLQGLGAGFSGNVLGIGGSVGGGLTPQGAGVGVNAGFAQPNAPNFLTQYVPYYQAPAYGALAPASTVASYPTYTYTTTPY